MIKPTFALVTKTFLMTLNGLHFVSFLTFKMQFVTLYIKIVQH